MSSYLFTTVKNALKLKMDRNDLEPQRMKAVFSEEKYVPLTIYLSLELIYEMR